VERKDCSDQFDQCGTVWPTSKSFCCAIHRQWTLYAPSYFCPLSHHIQCHSLTPMQVTRSSLVMYGVLKGIAACSCDWLGGDATPEKPRPTPHQDTIPS